MNTRTVRAAIFATLIAGAAATALAQKVNIDSDPAAPFSSYKTYMWTVGTPSPNPLGDQRIHDGVDQQLRARGLTKRSDNPDLVVATHVLTHEEKQLIANGFGYGWYGGGFGTVTEQTYVQGTLVVDLYDAHTKKMVWRGTATDTASDKADKNTKKVNKALAKMFERYPARPAAAND
jgi:hypothetical protein